ncbi:MAG: hypothetical protein AAGF11_48605 [Myxococcota bacterium]
MNPADTDSQPKGALESQTDKNTNPAVSTDIDAQPKMSDPQENARRPKNAQQPRGAFAHYLAEVKAVFPSITPMQAAELAQRCDRLSNARRAAVAFGITGIGLIVWSTLTMDTALRFMTLCGIGSGCLGITAMFLGITIKEIRVSGLGKREGS